MEWTSALGLACVSNFVASFHWMAFPFTQCGQELRPGHPSISEGRASHTSATRLWSPENGRMDGVWDVLSLPLRNTSKS